MSGASTVVTGTLFLHLEVSNLMDNARQGLAAATEDTQERGFARSASLAGPSQKIGDGVARLSGQGDLYAAIGELLSRLKVLKSVMDAVSEVSSVISFTVKQTEALARSQIHPFVTISCSLLSGLYNVTIYLYSGHLAGNSPIIFCRR